MVLFRKKKESGVAERIIQLSIIQGNNDTGDVPGKIFSLHCGNNVIGRDPVCEIVLNSETVSRRHANLKVSYNKKKFTIIDLGSANGVIIKPSTIIMKGKKLVKSGDEIQIGEILLRLLALDQDEALQTVAVDLKDLMKEIREKSSKKTK